MLTTFVDDEFLPFFIFWIAFFLFLSCERGIWWYSQNMQRVSNARRGDLFEHVNLAKASNSTLFSIVA